MTSHTTVPANLTTPLPRVRAAATCLVGGAVVLALARALSGDGGTPAERLQQAAVHSTQMTASVLLAIAGFAAVIPGFLAVASRVHRRGSLVAGIGSGLCVAGFVGFAVLAATDLPAIAAAHVSPPSAAAEMVAHMDASPALSVLSPVAVAGFFFGPFLVTLGARRAGLVPAWLPWGVLVSAVLQPVGLALTGPSLTLRLLDTACQLVFVVMVAVLARLTLVDGPHGQ